MPLWAVSSHFGLSADRKLRCLHWLGGGKLRQDFTIEALLSRLWKARRTMAVANSDASSLLGGWSFRKDNLSRSLSHFVSLWDGDPTSIDRRNPESPEIFFYQRRLTALIMGQVNVIEDLLFSQAAGNGFTARCLPSMDRERPKPPADTSTTHQAALDTIADMRELVIRRRADQDANAELLQGVLRRPVIHPDHDARDLLAAASAKFDALADATDNLHERGFWASATGRAGHITKGCEAASSAHLSKRNDADIKLFQNPELR